LTSPNETGLSRRQLMQKSSQVAVASALVGMAVPLVHASEDNTIRIALVGCGGRGTGAASNALTAKNGPTKLVAMADVFEDRLASSYKEIKGAYDALVDVPDSRKFVGFDGYKKAMDSLRPGDVVILATPPAFRWVHFTYAIQKGLNVFMEKPVAVDGPAARRMFKLAEESEKRKLKVGVGLMCRHCEVRRELFDRIKAGEIGDLVLLRAYRMAGPTASAFSVPRPEGISELAYQIRRFHSFLWASGGAYSDFLIHNIDECCWMKDSWPTKAQASGGRHYRGFYIDQNFDTYSVEYTFPDGAKLYLEGRCMIGCQQQFASLAHGSKGSAVISSSGHFPAKSKIYKNQNMTTANIVWKCKPNEPDPYQLEWNHLLEAIRQDKPYNEVKRGVEASLVTAMGRMAAHTGRVVTRDDILEHDHEFAPHVDQLATINDTAPVLADLDGKYPIPMPGRIGRREYAPFNAPTA
jgi:predicted dehydrogenase